jgi:hypothetical protein
MALAGDLDDKQHANREGPEVGDEPDREAIKDNNADGLMDELGDMSEME